MGWNHQLEDVSFPFPMASWQVRAASFVGLKNWGKSLPACLWFPRFLYKLYRDVSENSRFSPQIIHFNRVFHYKPSILGYPYFWKHPYMIHVIASIPPPSISYHVHPNIIELRNASISACETLGFETLGGCLRIQQVIFAEEWLVWLWLSGVGFFRWFLLLSAMKKHHWGKICFSNDLKQIWVKWAVISWLWLFVVFLWDGMLPNY